jgi:hypothetical protein
MPKSKYDDARNKTSWLSPSGDFHPVDRSKDIGSSGGGNTHDDWALAHGVSGGEASLHDDGWIRVTNSGRTLHLSTYPGFTLSQKQASSAKDFAIASGLFDEVVFDTGLAGKKKTVWSSGSPNARAFCPTGDGGGLDNSCGAKAREPSAEGDSDSNKGASATPPAGSTPIPDNHIRLYHYVTYDENSTTEEDVVASLEKNGLDLSKAKGSAYGEPNLVWASGVKPKDGLLFVEFSVPWDDKRFFGNKIRRKDDIDLAKYSDFTLGGSVSPDEFIAIHRPSERSVSVIGKERRAFCPTGDGGGVDNSCSADDSAGSPQLHAASERLTPQDLEKMISDDGKASRSVEGSMKLLKSKRRFELVGALTQSMPVDSVDAGDFSSKTVASAAPKGKSVSGSLSREIADAVEGIYGDLIRTANEQKAPRSLAIKDAALKSACFVSQMAAGVKEYPDILDSPVHVMRGTDIFDRMIDDGLGVAEAAKAAQHAAAMYSGTDDIIIVNADAGIGYINSVLAAAASVKNEETGEWESVSGGVPFYSTSQLGHSIAHENAHLLHYRAVRTELGLPHGKKLEKDEMLILASSLKIKCVAVMSHIGANPEVGEKLMAISGYAMTNPLETVAEYYTALALGVAKRDSDIDEVMVILGFPKDKLPAGKKGKKQ